MKNAKIAELLAEYDRGDMSAQEFEAKLAALQSDDTKADDKPAENSQQSASQADAEAATRKNRIAKAIFVKNKLMKEDETLTKDLIKNSIRLSVVGQHFNVMQANGDPRLEENAPTAEYEAAIQDAVDSALKVIEDENKPQDEQTAQEVNPEKDSIVPEGSAPTNESNAEDPGLEDFESLCRGEWPKSDWNHVRNLLQLNSDGPGIVEDDRVLEYAKDVTETTVIEPPQGVSLVGGRPE